MSVQINSISSLFKCEDLSIQAKSYQDSILNRERIINFNLIEMEKERKLLNECFESIRKVVPATEASRNTLCESVK